MKTCYWSSICGVYKRHKNYKNFKCRECTRNNRAKNVIRCQEHFEKLGGEMKDLVKCCNCGWSGTVETGQEECPACKIEGCLAWQDENRQEIEG